MILWEKVFVKNERKDLSELRKISNNNVYLSRTITIAPINHMSKQN